MIIAYCEGEMFAGSNCDDIGEPAGDGALTTAVIAPRPHLPRCRECKRMGTAGCDSDDWGQTFGRRALAIGVIAPADHALVKRKCQGVTHICSD